MKAKSFLLLLFVLALQSAGAQLPKLKRTFPVPEPLAVTADAQGLLYVSSREGEIFKYSPEGKLLASFSPQSAANFNVLDASSSLQLKAFNENNQTLTYFDRFLNPSGSLQLPPEHFSYVSTLCWSRGNSIWLADVTEMQLRKWSIDTREELFNLKLYPFINNSPFEVRALKEHQHRLYLFTAEKVYIFDQMGNYEKELPLPSWKSIAFSDKEIILLEEDQLKLIHLYIPQERILTLPKEKGYQHLAYSKGEVYLFNRQQADVYLLKP